MQMLALSHLICRNNKKWLIGAKNAQCKVEWKKTIGIIVQYNDI